MLRVERSILVNWIEYECRRHRRYAHSSAVQTQDASNTRNIALMAHIDSGKTTLTESILHASSYISAPGSVDTGSTTTDFLPTERERGITIQSASIPVKWKKWTFNLIDTPGHVDFGMEVESASRVVDGAVVLLDSVEGVEGQTKGVWRQLDRHQVPTRMVFLNKLDRPGASLHSSFRAILSHKLHPKPMLLTLPIASFATARYDTGEPGIEGILDLVNWEVWKWSNGGISRIQLPKSAKELLDDTSVFPASHPLKEHLLEARSSLVDNLSLLSPSLFSDFDALPPSPSPYLSLPSSSIMSSLRELTLRKEILPVLSGSALKHVGTELLMNYIGELLASPVDIVAPDAKDVTSPGEVQMLAWKVGWDKRKGWMTFVRIYQGTLTRQTTLVNTNTRQKERVSKLLLLYASRHEEVDVLPFGSVGVILGLKHTRTGDTLVSSSWGSSASHSPGTQASAKSSSPLRDITPPPAVISASVLPQSHADLEPVQEALQALSRTDPSVRITEEDEGQTLVHGLGALHLEIVEGRLRDEWGVRCTFGKRHVSYRESFGGTGSIRVEKRWEKDVGEKKLGARVSLDVRLIEEGEAVDEVWGGNIVVDSTGARLPPPDIDTLSDPSISSIASGLSARLSSSPFTTLPISNAHITLRSFSLDPSAPPSLLTVSSSVALGDALEQAGGGNVMEPHVRVKVDVAEESVGKCVRDLTENGGQILDLGSSSSSTGTALDEELTPYSETDLYIPPAWLSPSAVTSPKGLGGPQIKRSIHAVAPLSKMLDYSSRLRAVSGGLGTFEMSNEGFREVSEARRMEILREIGRA